MGEAAYSVAALCILFYSVPWAVAFIVNRADTDDDDCKGPAWNWSLYAIIYFIWTSLGCITYILLKWFQDHVDRKVARIALGISFVPMVASGPMVVGLVLAYGKRSQCPDLAGLLTTWFIMTMILLAIPYLIMSLSFYFGYTSYLSDSFGPQVVQHKAEPEDNNMVELKVPLNIPNIKIED